MCRGGEGRQEGEVGRQGPGEHLGLSPTQGEKPSSRKGEGGLSPRLLRVHGTWHHLYVDPKGSQASQLGLTSLSAQGSGPQQGGAREGESELLLAPQHPLRKLPAGLGSWAARAPWLRAS